MVSPRILGFRSTFMTLGPPDLYTVDSLFESSQFSRDIRISKEIYGFCMNRRAKIVGDRTSDATIYSRCYSLLKKRWCFSLKMLLVSIQQWRQSKSRWRRNIETKINMKTKANKMNKKKLMLVMMVMMVAMMLLVTITMAIITDFSYNHFITNHHFRYCSANFIRISITQ